MAVMTSIGHILLRFLADYLFAVLVIIAAIIVLRLRQRRGEVITRGVLAGLCALIVDKSSGLVYYHDRPFIVKGLEPLAINPHNNAFPSDHALLVFVAALVVWVATKNWKWGIALVAGGAIVGWARVVALVHWPVDIVGSFVIAAVFVGLWFWLPLPAPLHRLGQRIDNYIRLHLPVWLGGYQRGQSDR